MNAVGIVFSNIHDRYVSELTRNRTMASVPFACRYRLVDFVLSNMVNSNITKVGIITKYNYQSLMDHVASGKDWDLSRKNGGIILLPPYGGTESKSLYKSRLEALKGIMGFVTRCDEEYVVLTDSDKIININYADIVDYAEKVNADLAVVYKRAEVSRDTSQTSVLYDVDESGRVVKVSCFPQCEGEKNVCQNIFVLRRELLVSLVTDAIAHGYESFHRDVIERNCGSMKIMAYRFHGYSATIDSLTNYFKYNMEMLDKEKRDAVLAGEAGPVYTKVRDSAPTRYGNGSVVKNSLIADGCVVEGLVENSLLFRGVKVGKGCKVRNSILMQDTVLGENVVLDCVVSDKNVYISDRRVLAGCEKLPYFIAKNMRV